jgi:hypothetical protein
VRLRGEELLWGDGVQRLRGEGKPRHREYPCRSATGPLNQMRTVVKGRG